MTGVVTAHSPIILDAADERGVPTRAHCECGWTWVRPVDDPWADTLPELARAHRQAAS